MSDIVDSLRCIGAIKGDGTMLDAANEIERLRSEREVQDAALSCLRADMRECASVLGGEIERLRAEVERLKTVPAGFVRYCYECGAIGEVPAGNVDCCPDGNHAVRVPSGVIERLKAAAVPDVDWLSNVIRAADGANRLGAGALAEKIVEAIASAPQPPTAAVPQLPTLPAGAYFYDVDGRKIPLAKAPPKEPGLYGCTAEQSDIGIKVTSEPKP